MNDIIEIIESRRIKASVTGSVFDQDDEFIDKFWNSTMSIAKFIDNDERLSFFDKDGKSLNLGSMKEGFVTYRDKTKIMYGHDLIKYLDGSGIIEIKDAIGNFIKIRIPVTGTSEDVDRHYQTHYKVQFSKRELRTLSRGIDQGFVANNNNIYIESSETGYNLYFESVILLRSDLRSKHKSGIFFQGDAGYLWNCIYEKIEIAEEIKILDLEFLKNLEKYNHKFYLYINVE